MSETRAFLEASGRFKALEMLGEGGQAEVWKVRDTKLDVIRAIKVLAQGLSMNEAMRRRFLQEARLMAQLSHPNIVAVYDVGTQKDAIGISRPFIVMQFMAGRSLQSMVRTYGAPPPNRLVGITISILRALECAHEKGVIHRDVKPANVLQDENGVCKLCDFGVAQPRDSSLTAVDATMGSLPFMAPEQFKDAASVDLRADIYSVGATLWSLAAGGRDPDRGLGDASIVRPRTFDVLAEQLRPIVIKAAMHDPDERYQSAAEMIAALEALPEMEEQAISQSIPVIDIPDLDVPAEADESAEAGEAGAEAEEAEVKQVKAGGRAWKAIPAQPDPMIGMMVEAFGIAAKEKIAGDPPVDANGRTLVPRRGKTLVPDRPPIDMDAALPSLNTDDNGTTFPPDEEPTEPDIARRRGHPVLAMVATLVMVSAVIAIWVFTADAEHTLAAENDWAVTYEEESGTGVVSVEPANNAGYSTDVSEGYIGTPPGETGSTTDTAEDMSWLWTAGDTLTDADEVAHEEVVAEVESKEPEPTPAAPKQKAKAKAKVRITEEPPPAVATVTATGGADEVWLQAGGTRVELGTVPPGAYEVHATFDGTTSVAGAVTVKAGESIAVHCSGTFKSCKQK